MKKTFILFISLLSIQACKQPIEEEIPIIEEPYSNKIIYHYNNENRFTTKQVEIFTNYRSMAGNETFIKLYNFKLTQVFTTYEENYDNGKTLIFINFIMPIYRDAPQSSTIYKFKLDEKGANIISLFQIPNEDKIVCLLLDEETDTCRPILYQQMCGNSECCMEKMAFSHPYKYNNVKNIEDFMKVYRNDN
jgi:hypothetical protein